MKPDKCWIDPIISKNPERAYKKFRTSGPIPSTTKGKRAIVIGAISSDGLVRSSFEFLLGFAHIKKIILTNF